MTLHETIANVVDFAGACLLWLFLFLCSVVTGEWDILRGDIPDWGE